MKESVWMPGSWFPLGNKKASRTIPAMHRRRYGTLGQCRTENGASARLFFSYFRLSPSSNAGRSEYLLRGVGGEAGCKLLRGVGRLARGGRGRLVARLVLDLAR